MVIVMAIRDMDMDTDPMAIGDTTAREKLSLRLLPWLNPATIMVIMVTVLAMDMGTGPTDTDLMVMARERLSLATTGMDIMVIVVTDMDTGPMATEATMASERPRLCPSQDTITDITDIDPMVMDTGPMEATEDTTARERLSQFTDMDMEAM